MTIKRTQQGKSRHAAGAVAFGTDKSFIVKDEDFKTAGLTLLKSGGWCVAVARKKRGVAVRDSKDPRKTTIFFTPAEWACFVQGVKAGEFDPVGGVPANLPV